MAKQKIPGKRGLWGDIWLDRHRADGGGECAQTGVFLAATGAVCEDGVELACVQLLAGEQNLYTGS